MSKAWEIVKQSWSEMGIYSNGRRIAVVEIGDDVTEETQDIAERQMAEIAHLIAAAPELYAALQLLSSRLHVRGNWKYGCFDYNGASASELESPLAIAQIALDKARGEA